jgi:hypothetical protein
MAEVFMGGRDIAMKGAPDFLAIFKKKIRNQIKKTSFSTESKEQHQQGCYARIWCSLKPPPLL